MTPTISVIMPCLNGERHIQAAIDCVLGQTLTNFELIVVDNGSTDRTAEIVAAMTDTRIRLLHQPERGVSRARNLGLREARGEFIAFLDSDDTWEAGFLQALHAALASDSSAVLAYCGWQNMGLPGARSDPFVPPDYQTPDKAEALLEGCRWPIHACLVRQDAIVAAGEFNDQLTIAEDYLLWLEVSTLGALRRVPEVLAMYHHHEGVQATHNRSLAILDTLRAKQLFLQRHPEVARQLGTAKIESLTWGKLIEQGQNLLWQGDIANARPVLRKALLAGRGTFATRLRMLPSLLPFPLHRALITAKERLSP